MADPTHKLLIADGVVSLDNGRVIAERTAAGLRITRMTVLLEAPARPRKPRDVTFDSGRDQAQDTGRLAHGDVDTYVVSAKRGDLLQANIERFPGSALVLRVVQQQTGRVLNGSATEYARTWRAVVPDTGSYQVEVRRHAAFCDPDVTYLLTLLRR